MYGYWYSVRQNFEFTRQELKELFWTCLAFAFVLVAREWYSPKFSSDVYNSLFMFTNSDIRLVLGGEKIAFFVIMLIVVFLSLYFHVALQKLVGIRLGYKVVYSYWLNGILIGLFLSILTFGRVPILSVFILPGAVHLEHLPKLRLGKFRYGVNAKDIARVSLAGPLSHIITMTLLGMLYFSSGKSAILFALITANMLMLLYSIIPIPKIDSPTKMDSASDGLGLFFFNRTVYILCAVTVLIYLLLISVASTFSFVLSLLLALIATGVYIVVMKQPT